MAFTIDDAAKAIPKGSKAAQAAWVKMANKAVGRGMTEEASAKAATKMAGMMNEAQRLHLDLAEVGRVVSAANEKQLRTALDAIAAVLKALDAGDEPAQESLRIVEAWSGAANDAARGVGINASLQYSAQSVLFLLSDESDEPDQVAMLQKVYDAVQAATDAMRTWVTAEIGEIEMPNADDEGAPVLAVASDSDYAETALELTGDIVSLVESAVRRDGTVPVKLIAPGWGSTGYYPADVLERDGPKVFGAGTHMFWNHPGYAEESDRPERDLRDLAAVLEGDAHYDAAGPAGAGLYGDAKVMTPFRESIDELAPYIGVSIRTKGLGKTGEAEGKRGQIIEKLLADPLRSVDFVTVPGAGGQVLSLFEAARSRVSRNPTEDSSMDLREAQQQLEEATRARDLALQEAARAREALILREARDVVAGELAQASIPDVTRARLAETLGTNPPTKDGALDTEALKATVKESVAAEIDYLAKITGAGHVRGMGTTSAAGPSDADVEKSLNESFRALGLEDKIAAQAAKGRG